MVTPAAKTDVVLLAETGATMGAMGETRRALAVPARATVGGVEGATVEALAPTVEFAGLGKEGKRPGLADAIKVLLLAVEAAGELTNSGRSSSNNLESESSSLDNLQKSSSGAKKNLIVATSSRGSCGSVLNSDQHVHEASCGVAGMFSCDH